MNELSRMRYLDALGIENYVSRSQLPGAAPTRRLVIVRSDPAPREMPAASPELRNSPAPSAVMPDMPVLEEARDAGAHVPPEPVRHQRQDKAVRFSLAAIFIGQIAWVEELGETPLAREQVQLVQAMARAVSGGAGRPDITQFDWPTHQNHQLDLGPEAARAGVAGFLHRQIEQRKCRGLVILGRDCESRVPLAQLGEVNAVVTDSTLDMLREPARKRQVWRDLQSLVLRV